MSQNQGQVISCGFNEFGHIVILQNNKNIKIAKIDKAAGKLPELGSHLFAEESKFINGAIFLQNHVFGQMEMYVFNFCCVY